MSRGQVQDTDAVEAPPRAAAPRERRFVYGGEDGAGQNQFLTRGNRPLKRRRKSPFKIVSLIAAISLLIVFYVWNKIVVNRLADEVGDLNAKVATLRAINDDLRADIGRKSVRDIIERHATTRLKMIHNPDQPVHFGVEGYEPVAAAEDR